MSDGRKYYCLCEANCKFETMTKEQILAAIAQAAETGLVFDADAAFITKVKESNAGGFIKFWLGTKAQYNAVVTQGKKDPNCFYMFTDYDATAELAKKVAALTAADVGARPDTWTPTAADVGARPDTWLPTLAEIGAAPAGFGLGVVNEVSNADDCVENGWYSSAEYSIFVQAINDNFIYQLRRSTANTGEMTIETRQRRNGDWYPWEWVNPPMITGVEYRTTERFSGKPVYAKCFSAKITGGSTTGSSTLTIYHNTRDMLQCIRCNAYTGKAPLPMIVMGTSKSVYLVTDTYVQLATYNTYIDDKTYAFVLYYTKTTD